MFGDASKELSIRKQRELRQPANLPLEKDVAVLRNYMKKAISDIVAKKTIDEMLFVKLRNLVCCRITLFNAR